ncbi:ParA family protein [Priestia aryabhattai]|uniref:ParA family protein n=1 Tax=Priestia aryabhattai TaxID=412384 RepID=UPI001C0BF8B5|nr:ParA family protein [Priestia aryabhattai]MBU3569223.1 ParA family protein [Priestia aryabhattai]
MTKQGKVISFLNMKGGVGKTTLCINIAYSLVRHFNKRVLLIDMDPQFNATQALMEKYYSTDEYFAFKKQGKSIIKIFENDFSLIDNVDENKDKKNDLIISLTNNFDIVIGDLDLIKVEFGQRGSENLLSDFIENENILGEYDYVLIDCPPTHSFYTSSSLIASNFYLAPLKPDVYSVLGVNLLRHVVANVNKMHKINVKPLGVVFTMIDPGLVRQNQIVDGLKTKYSNKISFFENMSYEYEYIASGKMDTFMYDMVRTKNEISLITKEFIEEIDKNEQ